MRIKWAWHNTTAISRLLTTDLHLHGWEQKLDLSVKESAAAPYSKLVFHQFFLLHIYDRNCIYTSQTLERITFLCSDFSFMLQSPSMCWHLCKLYRKTEIQLERADDLTSFKDFVFKTCLKEISSLCITTLRAQLELSLYFMFLFLGSRVWSSRHTEDALHLPVSTLPPFLSFLYLQQPPADLLSWVQTAGYPWRWCTPKGTRMIGEVGDTCGNPSNAIPCFWMAPSLSVPWLGLHRSLLDVRCTHTSPLGAGRVSIARVENTSLSLICSTKA